MKLKRLTFMMLLFLVSITLWSTPGFTYDASVPTKAISNHPNSRQYTFSWQFEDGSTLAPRGGSTKGVAVDLETESSADWNRLQDPTLSSFEKDRIAILSMAGEYRSSFDFIEIGGYQVGYKVKAPYQSWGTEKVYVLENSPKKISLQHLLVMYIQSIDGKTIGPIVTKHWRQDWQFEPTEQLVYRGHNIWEYIKIPADKIAGNWLQTVWQVDDSPRYSGVAKWQHTGSYSSWNDSDGWRPLPRREFSVRSDYDVLIGSNRHTITPTGWIHEQRNLKAKIDKNGQLIAKDPILATEYGLSRYERIKNFNFKAGDSYIAKTKPVWEAVHAEWYNLASKSKLLTLKGAADKDQLFLPLFEYAENFAYPEEHAEFKIPADSELKSSVADMVRAYLK